MTENEKILHQFTNSLSEVINRNIMASEVVDTFYKMISDKDFEAKRAFMMNVQGLTVAIAKEAFSKVDSLWEKRQRALVDTIVNLNSEQEKNDIATPKQLTFKPSEAAKIANIKGKNTIIKYLKNGTIKGTQNPNNRRWTIKRQDLADYLGTDDF